MCNSTVSLAPPVLALALALVGCAPAADVCPEVQPPAAAPSPAPAAEPVASSPAPEVAGLPALMSFEPDENTAPEVRAQFGRLVGEWRCTGETRQPDGTFKPTPGESRWTFFYTLGAQAVGDVFEPPADTGGPVGINLRVYDPDRKVWVLAWTTPKLRRYDQFEARQEGDALVMRGDLAAKAPFPAHTARITFSELREDSFEWRYEAAQQGTDGPWQEFSRIHCKAAAAG